MFSIIIASVFLIVHTAKYFYESWDYSRGYDIEIQGAPDEIDDNINPFTERRKLRRLLTDEILSYLEEHHDTTCDDLKKLFINEELAFLSDTPKFQINLKILFLIFIIIVLICIVVIFIANQLHPPIYYYKIK